MNESNSLKKTKALVGMAIFTAIVVVLQVIATALGRIGLTPPSLVLIPIVIGSAVYGLKTGAWLGLVFGVVVLLAGVTGVDLFTAGMWNYNPFATAAICIVKGVAAGFVAGAVYKGLCRFNGIVAAVAAAVICPVINTGLFLLGSTVFFKSYLMTTYTVEAAGFIGFLFLGLVGVNFLIEMAINVVLSPVVVRILHVKSMK